MSSEYTFYISINEPLKLGARFSELLRCQPMTNYFAGTWSFMGDTCTLDIMINLGESFEDQEQLIGATPTAVILAPRKRLDWNEHIRLLREFIAEAIALWTADSDSTGAVLANDELLLAAKLPNSSIILDDALFDSDEFGQTGEFERLPTGPIRTNLSDFWPLIEV